MSTPVRRPPAAPEPVTLPAVARAVAAVVVLGGGAVLLGWALDVGTLKSLAPNLASMKVNTALDFIALALALTLVGRRMVWVPLVFVAAVTLLTAAEYTWGVNLGIDEALVVDPDSAGRNIPGRMAQATLVCQLVLAGAILAVHLRRDLLAQVLLVVPGGAGALALIGYAFGAEQLYGVAFYSTMAVHTAVAIVLLATGAAALVPGGLLPWAATARGAGATIVRRMVPVVTLIGPALGYLTLAGKDAGLYGERFGMALLVAGSSALLVVATLGAARSLERIDQERKRANADLQELNATLVEGRDQEWRRAEALSRSLVEERERFERAVAKVDDLLWTVEILPDRSLRLAFTSSNGAGLFGGSLPVGGDVARTMAELVHPDDRAINDAFNDKVRAGIGAEAELRLVGYDGVTRWVWVRGSPRRDSGRLFYDGITTNVTDRRRLAEQQQHLLELEQEQVRQLREVDRLREEFLAVTGHELRTPLTSIRGYSELLLHDENLGPREREYVSIIVRRSLQLGQLVEDLYDLARVSAGLVTLERRPLALEDAVEDAVAAHAHEAKEAGLELTVQVEPATVLADPVRVRQVLDNLLSNAVKYARDRGRIEVSAGSGDGVGVLTVADDGIGIPDDELPHVFDRMYRGSVARARGIKGTGLGLAVTKALVEAHGGTITAGRNPTGGTTFKVEIPLASAAPDAATRAG